MKIEILEISGESCANCYSLMPVLKKIADERKIALRHIEVAPQNMQALLTYKIDRVPTVILLKDGEPFARCTGYQPEEILGLWVDAKIAEIREKR